MGQRTSVVDCSLTFPSPRRGGVLNNAEQSILFSSLCARVRGCTVCSSMNHVHVLSEGNGPLDADILFVAEAPGRLGAARTGVPLTSDATGRRFDAFLSHAGIARDGVYVTNAVLCNPHTRGGNNRRPSMAEVKSCSHFLAAQLEVVRSPLVVALGTVALDALARIDPHDLVLARDVGRAVGWRGGTLVALYHPGVRSTLTRAHEDQIEDWCRLGTILDARAKL